MHDTLALAQLLEKLQSSRRMLEIVETFLHVYFLHDVELNLRADLVLRIVSSHFHFPLAHRRSGLCEVSDL